MTSIYGVYYTLASLTLTSLAWLRTSRRYAAPVRHDRILWIPPEEVVHKPTSKPPTNILPYKLVIGGDWDQNRNRIRDDPVYIAFHRRFIEQESWEHTGYIDFLRRDLSVHGGLSLDDAKARCDKLDELAKYIRKKGYKSQWNLEKEGEFIDGLGDRKLPPNYREISISIARDGDLLWHAGMHRLILAKLFDVDRIPVRVNARHAQWQAIRDAVWMNEDDGTYRGHPDVQYLIRDTT